MTVMFCSLLVILKPKLRASECRAFSGTAAARLLCG
jgi:hypothetical protein